MLMNKIPPTISQQSVLLANQARLEFLQTGNVNVICPKCHEHPMITTSPGGERTTVRCKCGFVLSAEINF